MQRIKVEDAADTHFFTADFHLGHRNILHLCDRPFSDIDEHDTVLINNANEIVQDGVCYHLGNFAFKGLTRAFSYIERLTGEWHFIPGGHDRWLERVGEGSRLFFKEPQLLTLEFDTGNKLPLVVVLCHYAMRRWDRSHYGSFHVFGHSHGNLSRYGRSMDVGVDVWNYRPISLRTVLETLGNEEPTPHHEGEAS